MPARHIHLAGASGKGVTILGRALAGRLGCDRLGTDDVYRMATVPPDRVRREEGERLALLAGPLDRSEGCLVWWGISLACRFDLVVLLRVPTEERLARPRQGEPERLGDALDQGGVLSERHRAPLAWAWGHDEGSSRKRRLASRAAPLSGLG